MIRSGQQVEGELGGVVTVGRLIGAGAQGEVYEGTLPDGRPVAVKWYFPAYQQAERRLAIHDLVLRGTPSALFLWPEDIVVQGNEFGYIMSLRPSDFSNLPRLLRRRVSVGFRELIRAASQTVSAFKALQSEGLSYCDISDGNLFFSPSSGDILICDNDNVGSAGRAPGVLGILGTPRYMAPEIVIGDAYPSPLTDSYSMAVLLFLLLCNDHPLQGAAEARIHSLDPAAMRRLYGTNPVFIFDPGDDSNRPVPGIHMNAPIFWKLYPDEIKSVFTKAFTVGLRHPSKRPTFRDWQGALAALEDSAYDCPRCAAVNFLVGEGSRRCWRCGGDPGSLVRLTLDGRRWVVVSTSTKLYARHFGKGSVDGGSLGEPMAEVVKHPERQILGLRNTSGQQWFAKRADGQALSVVPGKSIAISPGTHISFGDAEGIFSVV